MRGVEKSCKIEKNYLDCFGEFKYKTFKYTGYYKNKNPYGLGFAEFDNGLKMLGTWNNGKLDGDAVVLHKGVSYTTKYNNGKIGKLNFLNKGKPKISLANFLKGKNKTIGDKKIKSVVSFNKDKYGAIFNKSYTGRLNLKGKFDHHLKTNFKLENGSLSGTFFYTDFNFVKVTMPPIRDAFFEGKVLKGKIKYEKYTKTFELNFSDDLKTFKGLYDGKVILTGEQIDPKTAKTLKSVKSVYDDYLVVTDYCEQHTSSGHYKEFKKNIKIVLDKLISDANIPSKDINSFKDKAYNAAQKDLEQDGEHQSQVRINSALSSSESSQVCYKVASTANRTYRMMAKEATKSKNKKKRDL